MSIVLTALTVTSSSYNSLLKSEIEGSLQQQESIKKSALLYLLTNIKDRGNDNLLEDYSTALVDMFTSKSVYLQVFSKEGQLLSDGFHIAYEIDKGVIESASSRNYILRTIDSKHYLFINEKLEFGGDYVILTTISDVSHIDAQRTNMYLSFFRTSLLGLILMSFLVVILGRFITRPLEYLISASRKIAEGNYSGRVAAQSHDEIGLLTHQFNSMAEEIENKVAQLKLESQNKQDFIDNLTHELRTPLTSIIGYSELLLGIKYEEANFNKGLSFINSEGKRILNMVKELMDLILARTSDLNIKAYPVDKLITAACEAIAFKAEKKLMDIKLQGESFSLAVDETLFKMVLINLLDNAIKASAERGSIEIYYEASGSNGRITITDHGLGISEEHLKKITEPFYRVDKSRSRQEGGLGLGLALVKTILDAHGGNIDFSSEKGKGTSVSISIPLKEVK
jgi:signal transduction histidine kinase